MNNQGDCIHGREFCIECSEKEIPRRPKSIDEAWRAMIQLQSRITGLESRMCVCGAIIPEPPEDKT